MVLVLLVAKRKRKWSLDVTRHYKRLYRNRYSVLTTSKGTLHSCHTLATELANLNCGTTSTLNSEPNYLKLKGG